MRSDVRKIKRPRDPPADRGAGPGAGHLGSRDGYDGITPDPASVDPQAASSSSSSADIKSDTPNAQPQPERLPRDPQEPGGLELVALGRLEHQRQEEPVEASCSFSGRIHLAAGLDALSEKGADPQYPLVPGGRRERRAGSAQGLGQECRDQDRAGCTPAVPASRHSAIRGCCPARGSYSSRSIVSGVTSRTSRLKSRLNRRT